VKVLVVTNLYPPHSLGGYELSCQDVVRRWRQHGHEVTVLTTTTRLPGVKDRDDEEGVHRALEWYWAEHELQRPPPVQRLRIERANQRRLDALLDAVRPDVVSLWAMGGMSMSLVSHCLRRHQPMVAVVEDDWLTYGPKVDAWSAAWSRRPASLGRIGARLTGVATTPPTLPPAVVAAFASQYLQDRAAETGIVGHTTAEVVPLGIDRADFPPRPVEARPWRGRLLGVGRIEPRKGFDIAVRALADLPDATLRLVGPSNGHLDDLMKLARELDVAGRISCDVVPRDRLAATYADADALLFLSRWDEPFGLVPLEAMSQATPVIATRRGGSAEFLVDGVNCLEVGVDDPAAVAAAVRRLAEEPSLRERLARGGAETAAAHDVQRFADRLEEIHRCTAQAGR
jgi:glycosyltransferase involved in cell wall biosynthesis